MDSRKNTCVGVHADGDSAAASAIFSADASGYLSGMPSAVAVDRNLLLDKINLQGSEVFRSHSNDERIGCADDGFSSNVQVDRGQIMDNYASPDTLAREISFKWSGPAITQDSSGEKTRRLATNSCDPSSACVGHSSASSVSSCSAYVADNKPRNLFDRNEEVNLRSSGQDRANSTLENKHCESDCFALEDYASSVEGRAVQDSEYWQKSSAKPVEEEDQFEDVIFDEIPEGDTHESGAWDSLYSFEPFQNSFSESPKSSSAPCLSSSSFNAESSFASPLDSPLHQRPLYFQAKGSISLVNLIDAAIQGSDNNCLQRLRRIVAGHENICIEDEESDSGEGVAWLVVDILLAKMGFVDGFNGDEGSSPPVMLGAGAAVLAGNLIPWLPTAPDQNLGMSARTRIMKSLAMISNAYTRNRALCSAAGLLRALLQTLSIMHDPNMETTNQTDEFDDNSLLEAIEALASHSLSVSDLQAWLTTAGDLIPEKISLDLMFALERSMLREETKGPSYSFEFDGVDSGLLSPGEEKWPFAHGYAFATWLYIECFSEGILTTPETDTNSRSLAPDINDLKTEAKARMPRLFSFLSTDKKQIEAYFCNRLLVIETTSEKKKKSRVCFVHSFNPRRWYFVGVEHAYKQNLWGRAESEVRLYIDGSLCETQLLELPRVSKALESCCIGANPRVRSQSRHRHYPFFAEYGPVYIFKGPIGSVKMAQLAAKGADVLPKFSNGAGTLKQSVRNHSRLSAEENPALDTEIGSQLQFLYHPKLLVQRSCMDASPLGASVKHKRHAEVLGHVLVVHRTHPIDSIWAMAEGGPMALLPLMIGFLDRNSLQATFRDSTISAGAALLSIPIFRIIALAVDHEGSAGEMLQIHVPLLLANLLRYLLCIPWEKENELISSIIFLSLAVKDDVLKVQIFKFVLLDLKVWCRCPPEVQKMYLSSLADIVVMDEQIMRDTNAVQLLLDGCRSCYWSSPEVDSVRMLDKEKSCRLVIEPNPLVDELLVVIELLLNSAERSTVAADISCLVQFVLDCPQRNQVACVLHMLSRLVRQPNSSQAALFAESLLANHIIEAFLVLLQREIEQETTCLTFNNVDIKLEAAKESQSSICANAGDLGSTIVDMEVAKHNHEKELQELISCSFEENCRDRSSLKQSESSLFISENLEAARADTGKDDRENVSCRDNIMVAILNFLGAMLFGGHLRLSDIYDLPSAKVLVSSELVGINNDLPPEIEREMWLVYSLQNAFQAAPLTLLTEDVYTVVMAGVVGTEATNFTSEDRITVWCFDHWFQNSGLLMALLRSLPCASLHIQMRALQDMFILASTSSENRIKLTTMTEWPDWILQILISNSEAEARNRSGDSSVFQNIEDLIYSFLTIVLQFSMRTEAGWKDVEAVIHCAEWLTILGGSSIGEQRMRREKSLPKFKRRLLGNLLDFSLRELLKQAENAAAVAAAVAAENSNANIAKAEAEAATYKSMSLCRNSLVLLMFVEDHLRLQCYSYSSVKRFQTVTSSKSDVAEAMFEPYESVRCAFTSYGSYGADLEEGWKYRSQLWYEIELSAGRTFGGGGRDLEAWDFMLEKEENGEWIEMSLVNKTVEMLQALLLNSSCSGEVGIGGGAGSLQVLQQLLDNDQTFYAMLRMVLLASREEDQGGTLKRSKQNNASIPSETHLNAFSMTTSGKLFAPLDSAEDGKRLITAEVKVNLLECILAPLLTKVILESRRQRVLVALCILYAEIWHSVSSERKLIREQYLEKIVPLFVRLLRRWRPLLSGIHELTNENGPSSLTVEDLSILIDVSPTKATLAFISPMWAAAFASPTAAMALAFAAAGVSEGEMPVPKFFCAEKEMPQAERNALRSLSFSGLLRSTEAPLKTLSKHNIRTVERTSASQGDKERRTSYVQDFQVVNMESSVQRRTTSDRERAKRWNILKTLNSMWLESFQSGGDTGTEFLTDTSHRNKISTSLRRMVEATRKRQIEEIERRERVVADDRNTASISANAWSSFVQRLLGMEALIGPILK